jgi:hypothetical protein
MALNQISSGSGQPVNLRIPQGLLQPVALRVQIS